MFATVNSMGERIAWATGGNCPGLRLIAVRSTQSKDSG
jgi:hypothetical protein